MFSRSSFWAVVDAPSVHCASWLASSQTSLPWNWLNKVRDRTFHLTKGTPPAHPNFTTTFKRISAWNSLQRALTCSGCSSKKLPPPASSAAGSSLSQLDCLSDSPPRHGKCHNDPKPCSSSVNLSWMAAPSGSPPWQHPAAALETTKKSYPTQTCRDAHNGAEAMDRGTRLNSVCKFTRSSGKQTTQLCAF